MLTLPLGGGLTIDCVPIVPGRLFMGSSASDKDASADEKPQREVQVENGFFLGRTPVTVGQFPGVCP